MNMPALALIAAPPDSLRYSLQALLGRLPSIDSVQIVEDIQSLLEALSAGQPQLVVLDVSLLDPGTRSVLTLIKQIAPRAHTVVLVDYVEEQQALQAAPVALALLKGYPAGELFGSIERLLAHADPKAGT
jgi:DNA-binding NarL/FixJ family response regulator